MKFHVDSNSLLASALRFRMEDQGDVQSLAVENLRLTHGLSGGFHINHAPFHKLLMQSLNIQRTEGSGCCTIAKLFDQGFRDQTLCGYGLRTLANSDLGPEVSTGFATGFDESGRHTSLFNRDLEDYLRVLNYRGFISMDLDRRGKIITVAHGIPWLMFLGILEGVKKKLSEWFLAPEPLMRSYTASHLVSVFPYPHLEESSREFEVRLGAETLRHFHPLQARRVGKSIYTKSLALGVSTGWSPRLRFAVERSEGVASRIATAGKMYRTDMMEASLQGMRMLQEGLVEGRESLEKEPQTGLLPV